MDIKQKLPILYMDNARINDNESHMFLPYLYISINIPILIHIICLPLSGAVASDGPRHPIGSLCLS